MIMNFTVSINKKNNANNQYIIQSTVAFFIYFILFFPENHIEKPVVKKSFGDFLFDAGSL